MLTKRSSQGIVLVVRLSWSSRSGVQTPPGLQRHLLLCWCGELEDAGLLWNDGALVLRGESGNELGDKLAHFLWVQVTHFLRHINERCEDLVVALLWTFFKGAPSSTDLNREFLAAGVSDKLARLLFNVLGRT